MIRFSSILILIPLLIGPSFLIAQVFYKYEPQTPSKIIYQTRESDEEEWKDNSMTFLAYDSRGRIVMERNYDKFDDQGPVPQWELSNERSYSYNQSGMPTRSHYRDYDTFNKSLKSEEISETEYLFDTLETKYHYTNKNYEDDYTWEFWNYYEYDNEGREISRKRIHLDTNRERNGTNFLTFYNDMGCISKYESYDLVYGSEDSWVIRGSSEYETNSYCDDIQSNSYHFNDGVPIITGLEKWEREYDPEGREVSTIYYSKEKEEEQWILGYEQMNEYEGNKEITSTIYSEGSLYYTEREYDTFGRLIWYADKSEATYPGVWDLILIGKRIYTDHGPILYSYDSTYYRFSGDDWNVVLENYLYDANTNLIETNISETRPDLDFNKSDSYEYRCDGELSSFNSFTNYQTPEYRYQGYDKYSYEYLNIPPCDPGSSQSLTLRLVPNPAKDYMHFIHNGSLGLSKVSLISSNGEKVMSYEGTLNSYNSLELDGLKTGIYILQIQSENGLFSQRFVKID